MVARVQLIGCGIKPAFRGNGETFFGYHLILFGAFLAGVLETD